MSKVTDVEVSVFSECFLFMFAFYTSTNSWRGYNFTSVCLCVCVCVCMCVCVCVCVCVCEKNSSRTDAPIWMRFSLNGCLLHWLDPIKISDLGSKVKDTVTQYQCFLHNYQLTSLLYISALVCINKLKFGIPLRYVLCRFLLEFYKHKMEDDVMVTSFKFSPYKCPYFKFFWTYKLHFLVIQHHKIHLTIKVQVTLTKKAQQHANWYLILFGSYALT